MVIHHHEIKPVPGNKQLKSNQVLTSNLVLFQGKSNHSSQSLHYMCLLSRFCLLDILLMSAMLRKYVEVMMISNQCSDHEHSRANSFPRWWALFYIKSYWPIFPACKLMNGNVQCAFYLIFLKTFHYYISD